MSSKVEIIKASTKLPGYLFVLANITKINELIDLYCTNDNIKIPKILLASIGVYTQRTKSSKYIITSNKTTLIILNTIEEINCLTLLDNNDLGSTLLYVSNINSYQDFKIQANELIAQYPSCILTANISMTAKKKEFYIVINNTNTFYKKIKRHTIN